MTEEQAHREHVFDEPGPLTSYLTLPSKPDNSANCKVQLSLLFDLRVVCRQIAAEVDPIDMYRHNTFAFQDAWVFFDFTNVLTETQCSAIRDVSIAEMLAVSIWETERVIHMNASPIKEWTHSIRSWIPAIERLFLKPQLSARYHHLYMYPQVQDHVGLHKMRVLLQLGLSRDSDKDVGLHVYHIDILDGTADVNLAEQYVVTADDHQDADETEE